MYELIDARTGRSTDGSRRTYRSMSARPTGGRTLTRTATQLTWQWTLRNDENSPIVILDGPAVGTTGLPQLWITLGDDDATDVAYRFLAPPDGVDVAPTGPAGRPHHRRWRHRLRHRPGLPAAGRPPSLRERLRPAAGTARR